MLYGPDNPADLSQEELQKLEDERYSLRTPDHSYDHRTGRVSVRAWPETKCRTDLSTGEIICKHENEVPMLDCRNRYCLHREEMLARTRRRLTALGYAPGQKPNGAVLFLERASEDGTE